MPMPESAADLPPELLVEELDELAGAFGTFLQLFAGVDVFGVLAEDDHVNLLGVLDRGRDSRETIGPGAGTHRGRGSGGGRR